MDWKKVLIAGIAVFIASTLFSWLTCGWLFTWVYSIPPIIWRTPEEIMSNMTGMSFVGLISSIIFAGVYALLYKAIPGKGIQKGLAYGAIIWAVGALAGLPPLLFVMTISPVVIAYWVTAFLAKYLLLGAIVAAIYK